MVERVEVDHESGGNQLFDSGHGHACIMPGPALLGLDDHFEGAIDPLSEDAVRLGEVT